MNYQTRITPDYEKSAQKFNAYAYESGNAPFRIPGRINEVLDAIKFYLYRRAKWNAQKKPLKSMLLCVKGIEGRDRNRAVIRVRDSGICQWCGRHQETKRAFDVHHIDGEPEDTRSYTLDYEGMVTICHRCHLNIEKHKMVKE